LNGRNAGAETVVDEFVQYAGTTAAALIAARQHGFEKAAASAFATRAKAFQTIPIMDRAGLQNYGNLNKLFGGSSLLHDIRNLVSYHHPKDDV
jgi:hypothetical protein